MKHYLWMGMKFQLTMFLLIFFVLGCSDDNGQGEKVPESAVNKEFRFYPNPDRWSFSVLVGDEPGNSLISVNSSSYSIRNSYCYYIKKTDIEATISVNFQAYTTLATGPIGQYHEYDLNLIFVTPHQGTYTGTHKQGSIGSLKSESISGYFVFDSDEEPDIDNSEDVDFTNLVGTWEIKYGNITKQITFNADETYSVTISEDNVPSKGTYVLHKTENIISMKEKGGDTDNFKIKVLVEDELELAYIALDGTISQSEIYTKIQSPVQPDDGEDGDVTISVPVISEITSQSAIVKGTILGNNVDFEERGLCYSSINSTPTINDTKRSLLTDVVNIGLSNLFEGTTYYVRLYAKYNNKIQYGETISFQTAGTQSNAILFEPAKLTPQSIMLKAKLPNEITKYGICYGTSPKPLITDSYLPEGMRQLEWELTKLESSKKYYIRAYHIEGSKVIYYENSEVSVGTLGESIKLSCPMSYGSKITVPKYTVTLYYYVSPTFHLDYTNLPEGTYSVEFNMDGALFSALGERYGKSVHVTYSANGGNGRVDCVVSGNVYAEQEMRITVKCIETGMIYEMVKWVSKNETNDD